MEQLKLKPAVKAEWLSALRSGEFSQCKGKLSDGVGHCCLGVLSELAVRAGVISKHEEEFTWRPVFTDEDKTETRVTYANQSNYLDRTVAEWAFTPESLERADYMGWEYENPRVPHPQPDNEKGVERTSLAELNDDDYSFAEIADVVEENL